MRIKGGSLPRYNMILTLSINISNNLEYEINDIHKMEVILTLTVLLSYNLHNLM